jgi:hypothetical protein
MGMVIFGTMFPKIASQETRTLTVINRPPLPQATYGLIEVFCVDVGCDCRRVILNVVAERDMKHLATINYAFDPDDEMRGPFLDQLNTQSELSLPLLDVVREVLQHDAEYVKRLERHYHMVKAALADPEHPARKRLPPKRTEVQEFAEFLGLVARQTATVGRNELCPCGALVPNGKRRKFKNCCLIPLDRVAAPAGSRNRSTTS